MMPEPDSRKAELEEGTKFDENKPAMDLLPPEVLESVASVLTYGAKKYEPHNWMKGILYSRVYAAAQRHMNAFWAGEASDEESGHHHLDHALCCLMFLRYYERHSAVHYAAYDDRASRNHQ
jgi:hypothetical protein